MRDRLDELIREEIHLVRNERDKLQSLDQTLHFILSQHLHAQGPAEQLIELVRPSPCSHNFHALPHILYRHLVHHRRAFDQRLDELHTFVYIVRLEPLEIQGTPREMLGCPTQDGGLQ